MKSNRKQSRPFDIDRIQLNMQAVQTKISEPLYRYIFNKIERLGRKYSRIRKFDFLLKESKSDKNKNFNVAVELNIPGHVLYARVKNENPRQSVKTAFDELDKQLIRVKEKSTRE